MTYRILIAEDEPLMRDALRRYVESASDLSCVGEAENGLAAVRLTEQLKPDVVLMDIKMPELNGVEAATEISRAHPNIPILAITTFTTEHHVIRMLRAGARGFISKDAWATDIIAAIRSMAAGDIVLPEHMIRDLVLDVAQRPRDIATDLARHNDVPDIPPSLAQVLAELAKGSSNAEIAKTLYLTEDTVKKYISRLNERFNTRDRVQLLIRTTELGYIEPRLVR